MSLNNSEVPVNTTVTKDKSIPLQIVESPRKPSKTLPTTPEIAKAGVAEFERITQLVPRSVREAFLTQPDFWACFVGATPETGATGSILENLSSEDIAATEHVINETSQNFLLLRIPSGNEEEGDRVSLINLDAARRVVSLYPSMFPDLARTDLKTWIQTHQNEWMGGTDEISTIRHGLLSGFGESSFYFRSWFADAATVLQHKENLTNEELAYFKRLLLRPFEERDTETVRRILDKAGSELSDDKKERLIHMKRGESKAVNGFLSFESSDHQYLTNIDALYEVSGIEKVADRLKRELDGAGQEE